MVSKEVLSEIDRAIKTVWVHQMARDYSQDYLFREDSVKCALYFHLRKKLDRLLRENNLRLYPEFVFHDLKFRADLAIVEMDFERDGAYLGDYICDVVAIIEIKYTAGADSGTTNWVKNDVKKLKRYLQDGHLDCQCYFAVIYEEECSVLRWMDKRATNNWAKGHVTELDAGYIDGKMRFEVNSYNGLNPELQANET